VILHTHSRSFGQGPRKALGIHCTLAHSGALKGLGVALGDQATLLAYDLPSHGQSGDWDRKGNVHDVATDMGRALLTEPMDLIGHSFGATVAMRLAIEMPEMVRSLTMFEPVYFAAAMEDAPALWETYDAHNSAFADAYASGDMMEAARTFNRGWGDGTKWDAIPDTLRQYMADRIHFVPASAPFLFHDSANLLAGNRFVQATMPTLLMRGDQSSDTTVSINASLEKRLPDVRSVVVDRAGHMAPITHAKRIAAEISKFWASL
jgi:lipase